MPKSISSLKKKADAIFSLWIRNRDKRCITCGSITQLQNGHYVPRSWMNLRYNEKNCNAQCFGCNVWKKGNMDEYALALKRKYGSKILEELNKLKVPTQFRRADYERIIKTYNL